MAIDVFDLLPNDTIGDSDGLLARLFRPRTDKVLFAATKADHVTANQFHNLRLLLRAMLADDAGRLPITDVETDFAALSAVILAAVLGVLNIFLKPVLVFLTFPITVFTLGLFLLVINALIILLAARLVPGFRVNGFWWALLFSLLLSILTSLLYKENKEEKEA